MSLHISFKLSDSDLEYFSKVMLRARDNAKGITQEQILENTRQLLTDVNQSDATDFIRDHMYHLETLINMLEDEGWGLSEDDREHVLAALAYFSEPEDLIPDNIPGLGFLDDAIMIEIVSKELEHEIQAYREFIAFRESMSEQRGEDAPVMQRSEWLEERRQQLHSRMRRRRKGFASRSKTKSPFSLL